jgi:hypothetical protein
MKTIKIETASEIPENFTGIVKYLNGTKRWLKEGNPHREDGPAVEFPDESKYWYKNNLRHREDGPAVEWSNGRKSWYKEDILHREDGPAVEHVNGYKEWYLEGKWHDQINLDDYVVLDSYKGKYNLIWYRILGKDEIFEYPDIPGLIEK